MIKEAKSSRRSTAKKRRLFKSDKRKDQKVLLIIYSIIAVFIALFIVGLVTSMKVITSNYVIEYANLPENFDGYTIVQLSDYHKGAFMNDNEAVIAEVSALEPDIIVLTGDIIDKNSSDIDNITDLCESLSELAPILWVKGNHFYKTDEILAKQLEAKLTDIGVITLVNDSYTVEIDGQTIKFCGVDDSESLYSSKDLPGDYLTLANYSAMVRNLDETQEATQDEAGFSILLTHRFTAYEKFPEYGYSLALAGHSHGGQIKLPGGIDLIDNSFTLFPDITSGYNDVDGMPLIVSSGLGTSNIPLRLYNPPEVVCIKLKIKSS